jgi:membrane-associated phospholipid phosphatase
LLSYLTATAALIALYYAHIAYAGPLLMAHAAAVLLLTLAVRNPHARGASFFRLWYPLPYILLCYRTMSLVIPGVRGTSVDALLARWDHALWGVHPTVWLERQHVALLTELLEWAYALFAPSLVLLAWLVLRKRGLEQFRSFAFLITLGFLSSYVGYLLVPARGPRFELAALQTLPLKGVWLFDSVRKSIDMIESAHYDAFPSGHIEMALIAWWSARRISPGVAFAYALYAALLFPATVYLRYHYTIDLLAGVLLAVLVVAAADYLERREEAR